VGKRHRVIEEEGARIIIIVLGLDNLGAMIGHEFPEPQLEAVSQGGHIIHIGLREVKLIIGVSQARRVDVLGCLPGRDFQLEPQTALRCILGKLDLGQVDEKGVGLLVEDPLPVDPRVWVFEVVRVSPWK
jgi:hypothetical protein